MIAEAVSKYVGGLTFELTGDKELDRKFAGLPARVERKILRQALRPAADMILLEAQTNMPIVSGETRESLNVRAAKRSRRNKNSVVIQVVTGQEFFKGKTFYAAMAEFGHRAGSRKLGASRKLVPGIHVIEKAFKAKAEEAKADALQRIAAGIEAEAAHD